MNVLAPSGHNIPRAMRILHVINSLDPQGAERHLANLLGPLEALGVENHLVTFFPGNGFPRQVERHVRRAEMAVGGRQAFPVTVRMAREVDVVHTQLVYADIVGRAAAAVAGTPSVTTVQTSAYGAEHRKTVNARPVKFHMTRLADGVTARLARHIFAVSAKAGKAYVDGLHVPAERVEILANTVDLGEFDPDGSPSREEARAALGVAPDEFAVVTLGRLIPLKAHADAVRAVASVAAGGRKIRLVIAGEGGEREKLQALIGETNAPVALPGRRPAVATLKAGDLFILPSYLEGMPVSLIEAMAMGLPCLCSDIAENTETGGDAAEYFTVRDTASFARAITSLMDDAPRRSALAVRARERARRYAADVVAERFLRGIERALAR